MAPTSLHKTKTKTGYLDVQLWLFYSETPIPKEFSNI